MRHGGGMTILTPIFNTRSFTIAPATPTDRVALADFHADVRTAHDAPFLPEYIAATRASGYYQRLWDKALEQADSDILKVEEDKRLVGFVRMGAADDYAAFGVHLPPKTSELHQIYLAEDVRGFGLGQLVLREAMARQQARGKTHVAVNCLQANFGAAAFYERQGMQRIASFTEQNDRGGKVFAVPCHLYLKPMVGA